ncbi:hypothetical protein [Pseudanabaena sp. PCC 6802]|uniref:hypothetical protein n=1 Tax=Pseudanabaena sp. PCC 6802 TaxID=118173 RepID=UPI00037ABCD0|nr:hypothetical protein [Pseudanabaena sp. PCC 6802]
MIVSTECYIFTLIIGNFIANNSLVGFKIATTFRPPEDFGAAGSLGIFGKGTSNTTEPWEHLNFALSNNA